MIAMINAFFYSKISTSGVKFAQISDIFVFGSLFYFELINLCYNLASHIPNIKVDILNYIFDITLLKITKT